MQTKKKKLVITTALITSLLAVAVSASAYAFTTYFQTTATFSIDPNLTVSQAGVAYDIGTAFETSSFAACALKSTPTWTCPLPASTLYPGDEVVYGVIVSSPHATLTPSFNVTSAFRGFTASSYYASSSAVSPGMPTMTPGSTYSIWIVISIDSNVTTAASATFTVSLGA